LGPMRAITYAGETVVTTDDVATMLLSLAAALARDGVAEAVEIPIVPPEGEQTATAALVVGLGNDVLSVPQPWDGAEPDFSAQSGSLQKNHARYVPSPSDGDVDQVDGAADGDLDFDYDLRDR
jgi:hypothetical protein